MRRCRCGVGMLGELVYACGGFNGSLRVRSVDVYNSTRDVWMSGPPMEVCFCPRKNPQARRSTLGVAVLDMQLMIAVGGFDGATGLASAEALDPRQGQWMPLPSMNVRRSSVGVAALDGLVYAVGGYDGGSRQCLNTVEIYEARANKWRMGAPLLDVGATPPTGPSGPIGRRGHRHQRPPRRCRRPRRTCRAEHCGNAGRQRLGGPPGDVRLQEERRRGLHRGLAPRPRRSPLTPQRDSGDDGALNLGSIESLSFADAQPQWNVVAAEMNPARSYSGLALLPKQ